MTRSATSRRPTALTDAQLTWLAGGLPAAGLPRRGAARPPRPDRARPRAGCPSRVGEPLAGVRRPPPGDAADRAAGGLRRHLRQPPSAATCSSPTSRTATPASAGWRCCGSSRPTCASGVSSRPTAELPDHLCVVLEYAATVDHELGWRLIARPPGRARAAPDRRCARRARLGRRRRGGLGHAAAAPGRRVGRGPAARRRGSPGGGGRHDAVRDAGVRPGACPAGRPDSAADAVVPVVDF